MRNPCYLSLLFGQLPKSAVKCGPVWTCWYSRLIDCKENFIMSANDGQVLRFSKLSNKAFAPMKATEYAAGYDLRSAYEYTVPAHGKELVKTDLQIEVPHGTYGRIAPRSGLAWKNHIDVGAGVIDADYRGNIGVVLFNHSNEMFKILPGDRIAQLICEKITYPKLEEVESLSNTNRGADGFGSTGTK